jgi:hypothetical protein
MTKMYLVVGDWSDDGHGKYEKLLFEVNKSVEEVQQAYLNSCKLTGLSFHDDGIACDYEDSSISKQQFEILEKYIGEKRLEGCIEFDSEDYYIVDFSNLWWEFVKISLPDLVYNEVENSIPVINGFWGKLNHAFGYGMFY